MTDRDAAIADAKWAWFLGETALKQHLHNWCDPTGLGDYDYVYHLTSIEIRNKLGTDECLLKS
jgi:hypothetical protein